jgi:hypothetical protein
MFLRHRIRLLLRLWHGCADRRQVMLCGIHSADRVLSLLSVLWSIDKFFWLERM